MEGALLFLGGLAVAGVVTAISNLRTRQAFRAERDRALGEARQEVEAQLASLASEILALNDQLALDPPAEARRLYAEATASYSQAKDAEERAATLPALETVSDQLDRARWQLESARALLEGREPPAQLEAGSACFFDPTHGPGTETAAIDTSAGRRSVGVCSYCAAKLRSGRAPQPRMITVGGRAVPAAQAPRSYGGQGLVWVDDFSVVLDRTRSRRDP